MNSNSDDFIANDSGTYFSASITDDANTGAQGWLSRRGPTTVIACSPAVQGWARSDTVLVTWTASPCTLFGALRCFFGQNPAAHPWGGQELTYVEAPV